MPFGEEYLTDHAYFIAGGATLAVIEKYEADRANTKGLQDAIAKEYGAKKFSGLGDSGYLVFDTAVDHPALKLDEVYKSGDHVYAANRTTPEGRALQEKFSAVPDFDLTQSIFARRLTGAKTVVTNPDNLHDSGGYGNHHYREKHATTAATFQKYGDVYVVSIPRTVRGTFNAASAKASVEDRYQQAAGYTYEWWTPPDSRQIPYSRVVEMEEKEKGDQLARRSVTKKIAAYPQLD
ncbi:MAG: hypothetical protein PSY14_07175 [bacterium]|nr:hypothetical protein [bacterium]